MLLNTVALTDPFMQNDTNTSNNPAKSQQQPPYIRGLKEINMKCLWALDLKFMVEKDHVFSF